MAQSAREQLEMLLSGRKVRRRHWPEGIWARMEGDDLKCFNGEVSDDFPYQCMVDHQYGPLEYYTPAPVEVPWRQALVEYEKRPKAKWEYAYANCIRGWTSWSGEHASIQYQYRYTEEE